MFPDELRSVVEGLEIPLDGVSLASAVALRDLIDARVAVAVGEFEAAGLHELDGDVSVAAWLRHRAGMVDRDARALAVRSAKLRALPVLRDAFVDGSVSGGQVEVILANVPKRHVERFAEIEAELVPTLAALDIPRLTVAMTAWKACADAVDEDPIVEHDNEVHLSVTFQGRGELAGSFDADLHALVAKALSEADSGDKDQTLAVRRAEALGTVCGFFLDNHEQPRGRRIRPHVNVTIDEQPLGDLHRDRVPDR